MQGKDKILDDIAQLAGGAVGLMSGVSEQIRGEIKSRVDEMALRMNFVPLEEFERLEALVQKMKLDQEDLAKRLEKLEGKTK